MSISKNPTMTRTIEKNWIRDSNRRFAALYKAIDEKLKNPAYITNAIGMSIEQQRIFMAWLETEIQRLFFSTDWQSQYQLESYNRALKRVRADLLRAGEDLILTSRELDIARSSDFDFSAVSSLGIGTERPTQPIHQDALEFVFSRALESLRGITDSMARSIRQTIFDGVQQGKGILETARAIKNGVAISSRRAQLIARTETVQGHHQGTANEVDRINEERGTDHKIVWITARDERVRALHAQWHGTINTVIEAREKDAIQPFNCRCGQRVVTDRMLTQARLEKWSKERIAVMLLAA